MKKRKIKYVKDKFVDEETEWLHLTPAERFSETTKLWKLYIALGGGLDPERQTDMEYWKPLRKELEILRHKNANF